MLAYLRSNSASVREERTGAALRMRVAHPCLPLVVHGFCGVVRIPRCQNDDHVHECRSAPRAGTYTVCSWWCAGTCWWRRWRCSSQNRSRKERRGIALGLSNHYISYDPKSESSPEIRCQATLRKLFIFLRERWNDPGRLPARKLSSLYAYPNRAQTL